MKISEDEKGLQGEIPQYNVCTSFILLLLICKSILYAKIYDLHSSPSSVSSVRGYDTVNSSTFVSLIKYDSIHL